MSLDRTPIPSSFDFQLTRLEATDDGVWHLILDDPNSSANVMTAALQTELQARLTQLESAEDRCRGLIVSTGKPKIFIAGADIKYIAATAHFSRYQVLEFCRRGLNLYNGFSRLNFPTVALIQGACLGGGLEFALALDYRVAAQQPGTILGLPEVHLGLIPGWGATARVARIASIETAMRRIASGEHFTPDLALLLGLVDRCTPPADLWTVGLELLNQAEESWRERRETWAGPAQKLLDTATTATVEPTVEPTVDAPVSAWTPDQIEALATRVLTETMATHPHLHPLAPRLVVQLITRSAAQTLEVACEMESEAMAEVYTSASGQGLVHAFLLTDRAKK